ncbi:MAG: GNAT family N-acetyltransferase [Dysgonamonadaceae bacterium]|jgi:diamine N-acetyltransferase|nr:GNAT family N-acetyltransferase [Dysgonamonadaceae bacterium]
MSFLSNSRLFIRALEPEDLDVLYRWENDTDIWRYGSSIKPYSRFALEEYIADSVQSILTVKQLRMMIVEKDTDMAVGTLDLYDYDPINLRAGVGILLDSRVRRRGYGKESLEMLHSYSEHFLNIHSHYAYIQKGNTASYKLFYSCGYKKSGLLKDWLKTGSGFADVIIMQRIGY